MKAGDEAEYLTKERKRRRKWKGRINNSKNTDGNDTPHFQVIHVLYTCVVGVYVLWLKGWYCVA